MTTRKEGKNSQVLSVVLFILFLIALVVFLKGFGWCVGAACEVGIDTVLPGTGGSSGYRRLTKPLLFREVALG